MAEITLPAATGRTTGTRPSKRLRGEGRVPATVYGLGTDAVSVSVDWRELRGALTTDAGLNALINLEIDGHASELTIVKDLQRHPIRRSVLHVDFLRVSRDVAIEVDVPIVLHGEAEEVTRERRRRRSPAVPTHDAGEARLDSERDQRRHLGSRDQRLDPGRRSDAARGRRDRCRPGRADRHRSAAAGRGARAVAEGEEGEEGAEGEAAAGEAPSEGGGAESAAADPRDEEIPTDFLVVGLGNPGGDFERSRHNSGADTVALLARRHGASLKMDRRARALAGTASVGGRRVVLGVSADVLQRLRHRGTHAGEASRPARRARTHRDRARRARSADRAAEGQSRWRARRQQGPAVDQGPPAHRRVRAGAHRCRQAAGASGRREPRACAGPASASASSSTRPSRKRRTRSSWSSPRVLESAMTQFNRTTADRGPRRAGVDALSRLGSGRARGSAHGVLLVRVLRRRQHRWRRERRRAGEIEGVEQVVGVRVASVKRGQVELRLEEAEDRRVVVHDV